MTPPSESGPGALRVAAIVAACLLLTLVLVLRGFPYDLLAQRVASGVEAATGTRVSFSALEPRLTLGGPGFEATGVRIQTADGTNVQVERAALRPAWSLAWLHLTPALRADVESSLGNLDGTFVLGSSPGFSGRVEAVDLGRLPVDALWQGLELSGLLQADVDLASSQGRPQGTLALHAEKGSVHTPELPVPLPFDTLDGQLVFGDGRLVEVKRLHAQSQLFSADLSGSVGEADSTASAPLDLTLNYRVQPQMRASLESLGLPTKRDGSGRVHVQGTPSQPRLE